VPDRPLSPDRVVGLVEGLPLLFGEAGSHGEEESSERGDAIILWNKADIHGKTKIMGKLLGKAFRVSCGRMEENPNKKARNSWKN